MQKTFGGRWGSLIVVGVVAVILVVGAGATRPYYQPVLENWFQGANGKVGGKEEKSKSHELVRDGEKKPITPFTLRLSEEAAQSLRITPKTMWKVVAATEPRALPPLSGTLAYENALLYSVRPRFTGEVAEIASQELAETPKSYEFAEIPRPVRVGDRVKEGQLLAVVWSKDLGDKKANLIDALIDLRVDRDRLMKMEKVLAKGAFPEGTYNDQLRIVQKGMNAVNAAERTLRIWKLEDKEINALKAAAEAIKETNRDAKQEKDWARVEVRAPRSGTIVEMNTNVGDWVDPARDPPIFRIADLQKLQVWLHPPEEYLPILQKLMDRFNTARLTWKIKLHSDPKAPLLEGPIVRIAPSVDPNQHTLLVIGQLANLDRRMLVGQFITATIFIHPEDNLVEIPTSALNEENGESMVLVQNPTKPNQFTLRHVAVVHRFKDVVYIHGDSLRCDEIVATQGVSLMAKALRDLLAKEEAGKQ